jgi:hypothetical protein
MARGGGRPSLDEEGRALVGRLGGRWTANGGMCRCPAHDERIPSLSVRPERTHRKVGRQRTAMIHVAVVEAALRSFARRCWVRIFSL